METTRLLGEWLIAPLNDIQVLDFQCWRKKPKARRRVFNPFLHLKVGEHDVVLDGYDSVWAFLEVIQPDMYRSMVNAAMKGDVEGVISFAKEVESLIEESQVSLIIIQYEAGYIRIPNDIRGLDCYIAKDFAESQIYKEVSDKYLRLDFIVKIDTPYRYATGDVAYLPTYIYGSHPQLVLVRESGDRRIITGLAYNPNGQDVRFVDIALASSDSISYTEAFNRALYCATETEYPLLEGDNRDSVGMLTKERDEIESHRMNYLEV